MLSCRPVAVPGSGGTKQIYIKMAAEYCTQWTGVGQSGTEQTGQHGR